MYCIKFPNRSQRETEEVKGNTSPGPKVTKDVDKQMPTSLSVDLNTNYHLPLFNSKREFNKHYHTPTYALSSPLSDTHTQSCSLSPSL